MKIVFKFINGEVVSVPNIEKTFRDFGNEDFISNVKNLKNNDLPINFDDGNGESYSNNGKNLKSIEIELD